MPRRILIITNRVPWPLHDGGALAMHAMIKGYGAEGWEVGLLSMNTVRHPVAEKDLEAAYPGLALLRTIPFDNSLKKVSMLRNWAMSSLPEHVERFYKPHFEEEAAAIVKGFRPDVVQMESLFLTAYVPAIRAAAGCAVVLRMHNVEGQIWQRLAEGATGLKKRYLTNLAARMTAYERRAWLAYDLLLPITDEDARAVAACGVDVPVHVVPFGIKMKKGSPAIPKRFTSGYHLGAMDWEPNKEAIEWFLKEAWPKVHFAAPRFTFTFGGRNLEVEYLQPLPEGVQSVSDVEDAAAFMTAHDVLLVPLQSGGGIRVKILEAMAAGRLVISTAVGMQGIAARAGHEYIAAESANDFAEAIQACYLHPVTAGEIAAAGAAMMRQRYEVGRIMKGLVEALRQF